MELVLFIGGIVLIVFLVRKIFGDSNTPNTATRSSSTRPAPANKAVYRPKPKRSSSVTIRFDPATAQAQVTPSDLADLHDAFTGARLNASLGLFQCRTCKVYYHTESHQVLREENQSRCVACSSASIVAVTPGEAIKPRGRDFNPDLVTLSNYRSYVGRVITFEGYVPTVHVSRRGKDYAVMFENASWTKGFKLVFFKGAVSKVGGRAFILGLSRRTVRVRGLLVHHPRFGYQIMVSERSMILSIR